MKKQQEGSSSSGLGPRPPLLWEPFQPHTQSDDFKIPLGKQILLCPRERVPGADLDTGQRAENGTNSSALMELAL